MAYNRLVLEKIKNSARKLADNRNIVLAGFLVIVLALTWSGIKAAQKNYELQKQISVLKQQNNLLKLGNENINLQNKYYQTDQYLDLSARQNFGLAAPGETVLLVPQNVAMKYIKNDSSKNTKKPALVEPSKYSQNLHDWRDFLLGRRLFEE